MIKEENGLLRNVIY